MSTGELKRSSRITKRILPARFGDVEVNETHEEEREITNKDRSYEKPLERSKETRKTSLKYTEETEYSGGIGSAQKTDRNRKGRDVM
ncbi:hypothetical protein JTB14_020004 [Gonioctena quinquepunctata]|nr:hypothetical protein JTB14_020004 [Gonioctena quinquepunctata]